MEVATHTDASLDDDVRGNESAVILALEITDSDLRTELQRYPDELSRQRCALDLMRLGLLATRMAGGRVDARAVEDAGQQVVRQLEDVLGDRSRELLRSLTTALEHYFDGTSGMVSQRIESLIRKDGELEKVLEAHLGAEDSVLARTLAASLGERSPLLRLLSSTDREGIQARIREALDVSLADQRRQILREFSLDNRDSALARLVAEITAKQTELETDLRGCVDDVTKEFSLDQPDSALSRLVARVEATQKSISDQFSLDNEMSALSRISLMLTTTSQDISRNLTLDDEASALSRLNRGLVQSIEALHRGNQEFQSEVRSVLAGLQARRETAARSTIHGIDFEDQLGQLLQVEAQKVGDIYEATGKKVGVIKNCKVGDHVISLGPDSHAPEARIAWESKDQVSCDLKSALAEIEHARKNRHAQVGVFVFSRRTAPAGVLSFARYGADLIVVWDPEDSATDIFPTVAFSVARALAARTKRVGEKQSESRQDIEEAVRAIEKQLGFLEEIRKWAETVQSNGGKIADRALRMRTEIERQVATLDEQIAAMEEEAMD
jgi:hypothetical protein